MQRQSQPFVFLKADLFIVLPLRYGLNSKLYLEISFLSPNSILTRKKKNYSYNNKEIFR